MRHGTRMAIATGCDCDGCRLTAMLYARRGTLREPPKVSIDPAPYQAILQSLTAQGFTVQDVAERCALHPQTLYGLWHGKRLRLNSETASKLRTMLDLLPSEVSA